MDVSEVVVVEVLGEGRLEWVVGGEVRHLEVKRPRRVVLADDVQGSGGEEVRGVLALGAVSRVLVGVHIKSREILKKNDFFIALVR